MEPTLLSLEPLTLNKKYLDISGLSAVYFHRYGPNFRYFTEFHSCWEFILCNSGSITLTVDGAEHVLNKNDCFLYKPMSKHSVRSNGVVSNTGILSFESESKVLYELSNAPRTLKLGEAAQYGKLLKLASLICNGINESTVLEHHYLITETDLMYFKCKLESFFADLLRNTNKQDVLNADTLANSLGTQQSIVLFLKSFLQKNAFNNPSLKDCADACGYAVSYTTRLFKKETGLTINQYLTQLKIEKSMTYLSDGKLKIQEISDLLNFESVQYFCRTFKRVTNMSPTRFKNSMQLVELNNADMFESD